MAPTLTSVVAAFGASAKEKLRNPSATGQPEDQLRSPFEKLIKDLAQLAGINHVIPVGETSLSDLKTRPDYSVTVENALVGFVELKAPGKGGDPRRYKDAHDKSQWEKLHSLPNVVYTDGNVFTLFQDGELTGPVVKLDGDIETSGSTLKAPPELLSLFASFLTWKPTSPSSAKALAETTARLCRLLRDEVTEQLSAKSPVLTALANDWRRLLFPDAADERFADGYAQAVTFGMLMARARGIRLSTGLQQVAIELSKTNTLIGAALKLLTDDASSQETLKTSLGTLTRVLDAVDWTQIGGDFPEAWLYFYEDFLEVYDNKLRKQTGSYYTPPEVVAAMVRLTDEALRMRFGLHAGLASPSVTLADPAVGTGTFMLGVLRKIAHTVEADEGAGAVKAAINAAVDRLLAFEMQLGPFAVAQLRILAEIVALTGSAPATPMRMFVTDTLGNPDDDDSYLPQIVAAIATSRRDANKIKRDEPITVVLGNPPYKESAKGLGAWVEGTTASQRKTSPLADWMPPPDWGVGVFSRHLYNLYIYFWRWATWKVFDHGPGNKTGIVCFITAAGFLAGDGFQRMREYLRQACDDIWVIDCSPEGHQPDIPTRVFQGVQQPICIVLASRTAKSSSTVPASVYFRSLPIGPRGEKFKAMGEIRLTGSEWIDCPSDWRSPFRPASKGAWSTFPKLEDLFLYNGSGVMAGRTWIIAPDVESLKRRWHRLVTASPDDKEDLFFPHMRGGEVGDKHSKKVLHAALTGYEPRPVSVADDKGDPVSPISYGFRSFDRQWIIPDLRVINQANPELWRLRSDRQVFLTAPSDKSPTNGPALTFSAAIPDVHHYGGRGGRVFPLWDDAKANVPAKLLPFLSERLGRAIGAEDFLAYIAGIAAHPAFTARFKTDLETPGLRIPITADESAFGQAVELGRRVIWLHTFGERLSDPTAGRPPQPPRDDESKRPRIPASAAIPEVPALMPDEIGYEAGSKRLRVGGGYVENVSPEVWRYEVSGKQVLLQWFSYRKRDRERPLIGDRRAPSRLSEIQPDSWLSSYTTELLNVLNVLGLLVDLELQQADLLERICSGPLISVSDLESARALEVAPLAKKPAKAKAPQLF